jgi:hypothetical protein
LKNGFEHFCWAGTLNASRSLRKREIIEAAKEGKSGQLDPCLYGGVKVHQLSWVGVMMQLIIYGEIEEPAHTTPHEKRIQSGS